MNLRKLIRKSANTEFKFFEETTVVELGRINTSIDETNIVEEGSIDTNHSRGIKLGGIEVQIQYFKL